MTATATAMLNMCRSQIGYTEGPDNANKYGAWYGWDNVPYCAIGLTWAAAQVNALDIMHGRFAYCPYWVQAFQKAGQWLSHSATPQPGDIVFFDWTGWHNLAQHVGIVESVANNTLTTVEFNTVRNSGDQSDGGGVWRRLRNTSLVVGYGRPAYARQGPPVPVRSHVIPLVVDGDWGPLTTAQLQRWLRMPPTGVIDAYTRRALQARLGIAVDGIWGPQTHKALQRLLHVTQDGIWGPITVKALQRYLNRAVQ